MVDKGTKTMIVIMSLAVLSAAGFLLVVFSCMIWKNWWPLAILLFWALIPLPVMLNCIPDRTQWDMLDEQGRTCMDIGFFFVGGTLFSGVASPIFMAHWRTVEVGAAAMAFSGGILFCMALLVFIKYAELSRDNNPWD